MAQIQPAPVLVGMDVRALVEQYVATRRTAWEQYEATRRPAWEQYEATRRPAWEQYVATRRTAWEQYEATRRPAWEQYEATERPAWEQYEATERTAWEQYEATERTAWEQLLAAVQADPLAAWVVEHAMPVHQAESLVFLRALPATVDQLDQLAADQGWCSAWGRIRSEMVAAGVLPDGGDV